MTNRRIGGILAKLGADPESVDKALEKKEAAQRRPFLPGRALSVKEWLQDCPAEHRFKVQRIADFIDEMADPNSQIREVRRYPPHPTMTVDEAKRHQWIYVTHVVTSIEPHERGHMLYIDPITGKVYCMPYSAP
jgi:hypothetical protein